MSSLIATGLDGTLVDRLIKYTRSIDSSFLHTNNPKNKKPQTITIYKLIKRDERGLSLVLVYKTKNEILNKLLAFF